MNIKFTYKLLFLNILFSIFLVVNADSAERSKTPIAGSSLTVKSRLTDKNLFVEPNIERFASIVGWFYADSCVPAGAGNLVVELPPTHGNLRFAIENYPLPAGSGVCSGKIISGVAAYYTSKQTTLPFQTDTFKLTWSHSGQIYKETFTVEHQQVQFKELGTNYGWDDYTNKNLPALSVKTGDTTTVLAQTTPPPLFGTTAFRSSNDTAMKVISPSIATNFQQTVTVQGVNPITAFLNARNSKNSSILGKAEVLGFNEKIKTVSVTLIHQKNTPTTGPSYTSTNIDNASIIKALDSVYKQAAIKFKVTQLPAKTVAFDFNKDGKINVDSWMNEEMKAIVNAARSDAYQYNIFLVDNPSQGNCGVMNFNQKYGFVHVKPCGSAMAIAHELGHALGLSHTPDDSTNLMYTHTTPTPNRRLRRNQWLIINSKP